MSFQRFCVVLLVSCVIYGVSSSEYVPVLMWGSTSGSHSTRALSKLDAASFKNILKEQLNAKPFTVVFIEETLSVEDFSTKDQNGLSAYTGLKKEIRKNSGIYYPLVASALHTLNRLADPDKIDRVELTEDGLSADITPEADQFLYINLKDAREGEDRIHMLSRHDEFMTEMFSKLSKKYDSVLAIYTAKQPSWVVAPEQNYERRRISRSLANDTDVSSFFNVTSGLNIFIYFSKMSVIDKANPNYTLVLESGTADMDSNTTDKYKVGVTFSQANITFIYTLRPNSYWCLEMEMKIDQKAIQMTNQVCAPFDFSYRCSQRTVFSAPNETKMLVLEDIQTQIFIRSPINDKFSSARDCVGYFTVPIWSGLLIAFLIIFITTIGIIMMMDIRTMDRFDDPKGKTITITATE